MHALLAVGLISMQTNILLGYSVDGCENLPKSPSLPTLPLQRLTKAVWMSCLQATTVSMADFRGNRGSLPRIISPMRGSHHEFPLAVAIGIPAVSTVFLPNT